MDGFKLGVALSGGGIRGAAHAGVIKTLLDKNIKIDLISGTSFGAIVATLYSVGVEPPEIIKIIENFEKTIKRPKAILDGILDLFPSRGRSFGEGLLNGTTIEEQLKEIFDNAGVKSFKDTKIPLAIPSVDINSGKLVIFSNDSSMFTKTPDCIYIDDAPLITAVMASCAYPIVFQPVKFRGMTLVDGGLRMNLPVRPLRLLGADKVLAIALGIANEAKTDNIFETAIRSIDILTSQLIKTQCTQADAVLDIPLTYIGAFELGKARECFMAGQNECNINFENLFKKIIN